MSPRPDNVPRTVSLDLLTQSMGTRNLANLLQQIWQTARDTQQGLGEQAIEGNLAGIADLAAAARADCATVGANGLAARLAALEGRARAGRLQDPLAEIDPLMAEMDAFIDALEARRERNPR